MSARDNGPRDNGPRVTLELDLRQPVTVSAVAQAGEQETEAAV